MVAMKFCILFVAVGSGLITLSSAVNQAPFLRECEILEDSYLHDSIRVNLTQEEKERLKVEGQCFLACAVREYSINEVHNFIVLYSSHSSSSTIIYMPL